jgi:hypothetical protein
MLLPRYSLRTILLVTAGFAVVFLFVSLGLRGSQWAVAVAIGISALALALVVQALGFAIVWLFAVASRVEGRGRSASAAGNRRDGPRDPPGV